jgi:hypothetical protein
LLGGRKQPNRKTFGDVTQGSGHVKVDSVLLIEAQSLLKTGAGKFNWECGRPLVRWVAVDVFVENIKKSP